MVKHCGRCKQDLPLSEFHACTRNKDGKQGWCKSCRKKHKSDERKQYHRDRYHNDTDGYRNYYYTRTYKISLEDYNELMMKQGGVCAICGHVCKTGRKLSVDHCHTTGRVRGLLCGECNNGIGKLKDSIPLLEKAIRYLKANE